MKIEMDIKELPNPNKLELLADYIDMVWKNDKNFEVQTELRTWAKNIRNAIARNN